MSGIYHIALYVEYGALLQPRASASSRGAVEWSMAVHGHEKVRTYGHERSALMATKSPQFWPPKVRTPH
jgi:hypothetical protein